MSLTTINITSSLSVVILATAATLATACIGPQVQEPLQLSVGARPVYTPVLSISGLKGSLPYISSVKLLIDGRSVAVDLQEGPGGVWQTDLGGASVESLFRHNDYASNRSSAVLEIISHNDKGRRETSVIPVELTLAPEQTKTASLTVMAAASVDR